MPYKDPNMEQLFILIYWTILIKTNKATQTVENYFHVLKPEVYMHVCSMYVCMYFCKNWKFNEPESLLLKSLAQLIHLLCINSTI